MDIKDKLTQEDKSQIAELVAQCQVLNDLLEERKAMLKSKANEVLTKNSISPQLYRLMFNPSQNLWKAELKEGSLVMPNREARRAIDKRKN